MTPTNPLSVFPRSMLWRGKSLSGTEFEALIELLPLAALLYDPHRKIIVFANDTFLKLSSFSLQEIYGIPLAELFIAVSPDALQPGAKVTMQLQRRNRTPREVDVAVHSLGDTGSWLILTIADRIETKPSPTPLSYSELFRAISEITSFYGYQEITPLLERMAEITREVLRAGFVSIYQAQTDYPKLRQVAALPKLSVFPEEISPADLIRLANPVIWMPGKRVQTEIHRFGRMADLMYVASVPLGQPGAISGLLVVGGSQPSPGEYLLDLLSLIGSQISLVLQQNILLKNMQEENSQISRTLLIQKALIENSQEGMLVLQKDFKISDINPAAELMLGYADWEVKGQQAENILIGPEGLISALENTKRGIATLDMGVVNLHRRNGQSFPAQIQTIPIIKENDLLGVIVLITDVTANEQIKVRTQQLEQRAILGDFTAVFAHEVRNPINNISMGAQLLASRMNPDDPNYSVIQRILADCTRLNHLMESVLSFSRPMESTFVPLDLPALLGRILDRWKPRLARVNIRSYFQAAEGIPKINGDVRSLEQVFTNLITNAVEAMTKTGGTLAIRISMSKESTARPRVEVTVSDDGPGIPDEIRDRVFEPFVSANSRGTGLGLAITKRIVTAHQGSIKLDSFPGGTIFTVSFPVSGENP